MAHVLKDERALCARRVDFGVVALSHIRELRRRVGVEVHLPLVEPVHLREGYQFGHRARQLDYDGLGTGSVGIAERRAADQTDHPEALTDPFKLH